jgi:RHS repeat-associated protein
MPSSSLPYGNPGSINSITLVYDALGRMVEQQNGSTYTQMLYSPVGKTAIMNGQTLSKAFVGLPGGGTAIYKSSGLAYYRHADWLGSSRLTSTVSQTVYSDSAYAPFGEQYAVSGTADPSFTGQDSDTVSSLYDFTFREQSPSQGRWISPDPAGMKSARPLNPQSWNRYAYVNNNPLALVDPKGLDCVYLNDSGTDVEEVDAGDDCASGGIWVPGTYAGSGWVSNTGNWYFTEAGVGTPGVSVTAGWIDTPGVTSDQFLPGYGTATEMGAGTPGAGTSFGYTFCYQGASSCWP